MAYNLHTLSRLKWVMQQSLAKTLAHKHKTSVRKIYKKYQTEIEVDGKQYKVFQVIIHREGKKPLIATWGGIHSPWICKQTYKTSLDGNGAVDPNWKNDSWHKYVKYVKPHVSPIR